MGVRVGVGGWGATCAYAMPVPCPCCGMCVSNDVQYLDTVHGCFYYYNPVTQESRWDRPTPQEGVVIPYVHLAGLTTTTTATTTTAGAVAAAVDAAPADEKQHVAAATPSVVADPWVTATAIRPVPMCVQCEGYTATVQCQQCGDR
jgi:hypothetical protein